MYIPVHVAICIPTCNRPDGLSKCLREINRLEIDLSTYHIEVVVVDNSSRQSAKEVFKKETYNFRFNRSYHAEEKKGIPFVRNTCIEIAREMKCNYQIFIDDDEYPDKNWLQNLLPFANETGADAVTGPALPVFMNNTCKKWVTQCDIFHKKKLPHGSKTDFFSSCNLLLNLDTLSTDELFFDETMRFRGGSDTDLAIRLRQKHKTIFWCDTAIVYETVPEFRCSRKWIFLRYFRRASNWVYFKHKYKLRRIPRLRSIANGTVQIISGLPLLICSIAVQKLTGNAIKKIASGCGLITGSFGLKYQEYKKQHR